MDQIRPLQGKLLRQVQRRRYNRLRSRERQATEVGVWQGYQSSFLTKIADIESEEAQDLVDVAFVDEAEALELREAWFGFTVFEVAYPIVRHVESWISRFFCNLLANLLDPTDGQVQSLAFRAETLTSYGA